MPVDPWEKRKHPDSYTADELRQMIVGDLVASRPPGGRGEWGAAFLIGAMGKIARVNGWENADVAWSSVLAEAAAITGHTNVALA